MLCGMAQSLTQIVLFRVIQGACGAALVPLSQSVLFGVYPRERQGFAMALFGIGVMIGPVLGPVLGGWLTYNYSWRYVFYINLPIGIIDLVGIMVFLPDFAAQRGTQARLVRLRDLRAPARPARRRSCWSTTPRLPTPLPP